MEAAVVWQPAAAVVFVVVGRSVVSSSQQTEPAKGWSLTGCGVVRLKQQQCIDGGGVRDLITTTITRQLLLHYYSIDPDQALCSFLAGGLAWCRARTGVCSTRPG